MKPLFVLALAVFLLVDFSPSRAAAFTTFYTTDGRPLVWDLTSLPGGSIHWNVAANAPSIVHDAAAAAAQAWTDATGGTLNFAEGSGDVTIVWDSTGTLLADPLFLAYTSFQLVNDNHIFRATIVINAAQYTWHSGGDGGIGPLGADGKRDASIDSVLLHEMGHAVGLNHSDLNPAAIVGAWSLTDLPTMNSWIVPGAQTLHSDDIAGVRSLYGVGDNSQSAPPLVISASATIGRKPLKVLFTQTGGDDSTTWNFGDGTISTGSTMPHRFISLGVYTVRAECNGRSGEIQISVVKKLPKRRKR